MPFESRAQQKWMYANKPAMAAKWQKHTPKGAALPEHVKKTAALKALLKTAVVAGPGPSLVPGVPGPMKIQPGTAQPAQAPGQAAQAIPQLPGANDHPAAQGQGQGQAPAAPAAPAAPTAPQPVKAAPGQPLNAADATSMARIQQMRPISKAAAAYVGLLQGALRSVL
jgi:hypothetical protein